MKEMYIDTELTGFVFSHCRKEYVAEFTLQELRSFVKRIRKRAKRECKQKTKTGVK